MMRRVQARLKAHPRAYRLLRAVYRALIPTTTRRIQRRIERALRHRKAVFFVQVGSNDGSQGDPLHDLVVRNGEWKGMFIEPVGYLFDRLVANYHRAGRFIFEKKAIAAKRGRVEFYYVSEKAREAIDGLPYWYDQLGSFDRNHILKHLNGALEPYVLSERIEALPLQDLLEEHEVGELDLLHVDTEGLDYEVLSTLNLAEYRPKVVLYEHRHLSEEDRESARRLLTAHSYACSAYGGDTLAVRAG